MPMYSYVCDTCGRKTDEVRKSTERNDPAACTALREDGTPCDGVLVRDEGAEVNARMDHRWMP